MNLKLREIYFNDGYITPLFEIDKYNNTFNDLKYDFQLEDEYLLNLNTCVDNYDTINFINDIINKNNIDFIDKELWKEFLNKKHINDIKTNNKSIMLNKLQPNIAEDINIRPLKKYKTNILYDNLDELWKKSESLNGCHKICDYNDKITNIEDYKYSLLNAIFSSNINYKIKLCKCCNKPFITNNQNFQTCSRIFKDNITCNKYFEKVRKQYQYNDPIKHLIKNVRDKLKDNYDELDNFNRKLSIKKEEFLNNDKEFIKWIINDYYFTEKGKKDVIERLGLSKYL